MSELDTGLLSPVLAGGLAQRLVGDRAWLQAMLDAEAALVRVQSRLGVVPVAAADVIATVAHAEEFDLAELARLGRESANPVVGLVAALTKRVSALDPSAADYVHRGSTSQDIFDTAAVLVAARSIDATVRDLDRVVEALALLADRHRATLLAGRTLTQHAVPTTFGLKAAGWLVGVLDARDRLAAIRATLPVQLGGAAGTLAGYVEYARLAGVDDLSHLVEAYAAELDLAAPVLPWHTRRAVFAVLGSALAGVTGALGKLAVDVLTLARTEIGEVSEPSGVGRGTSSAMPQKRNPVLATLLRSAALQVPALVCVLFLAELSEDERAGGVWQSEWQPLRECLRLAGAAAEVAAELVEGLEVHVDRMRENLALSGGLVVSERVAAVLAPRIGKAQAKTVVARAALLSAEGGVDFGEALLDSPELTGLLDAAELKDLLGVEAYLGLADELVDRALRRPR